MIRLEDISYVYSEGTPFEKTAINSINFNVNQGEFIGIIGHTGCGKSTLIKHLNGTLKPTKGKVIIDGQNIWENKSLLLKTRFDVGLVFQYPEYQLFEETIYKDIAFGPKNMGLSENEINERIHSVLSIVGLSSDILNKSPFELSGGQKRRVAIAGVMSMRPKVLVLDEPTAGLDPMGKKLILDNISKFHKETNSTIIFVTHSMEDVAKYASKILVMNKGKKLFYDVADNIFSMFDKLDKIGLSIPQISRIFMELEGKGIKIDKSILTVEDGVNMISSLLKKGANI